MALIRLALANWKIIIALHANLSYIQKRRGICMDKEENASINHINAPTIDYSHLSNRTGGCRQGEVLSTSFNYLASNSPCNKNHAMEGRVGLGQLLVYLEQLEPLFPQPNLQKINDR
jgi:hypothetical protein